MANIVAQLTISAASLTIIARPLVGATLVNLRYHSYETVYVYLSQKVQASQV